MDNPLLKEVLVKYPDVDPRSLNWPEGANTWNAGDLDLFIGSGGFLKPKRKSAAPKAKETEPPAATTAKAAPNTAPAPGVAAVPAVRGDMEPEEMPSSYEVPGFSVERMALTMPVRVHCEDTAPHGHVRLESLVAYAERIRSLGLKQLMGVSLADLKEKKLAILATEYVVEVVGSGVRVLDTLRIDTTPEFPSAPLFPWDTSMYSEDGQLYMRGRFALNLCRISDAGAYGGIEEAGYKEFTGSLRKWTNPARSVFTAFNLRFFNAYAQRGSPFKPTLRSKCRYIVRSSDCDMYNVLFQARVASMMESCHPKREAMAMYVNIRMSVRPDDELDVHVFHDDNVALFICLKGKEPVLTAFAHYGASKPSPMCREEIKCASIRLPLILQFINSGTKPPSNEDFDFSSL